jgi:uncharacterized protein (DUF885 family)
VAYPSHPMRSSCHSRSARATLLAALAAFPAALIAQPAPLAADLRLRALYTAEWEWRRVDQGQGDGDERRQPAAFPRVDAESQHARERYWTRVLASLDSIPLSELSDDERINAQVFRAVLVGNIDELKFRTYESPFNSDTFFWTSFTPRQGFATADDYRRYLARLRAIPAYFDAQMTNMRAGLARGFTVPRVSMAGRDKTMLPYLAADTTNPLWTPLAQLPRTIEPALRDSLRSAARDALREAVVPAYRSLLTMWRSEFFPRMRTTLAAESLPDGKAFYRAQIARFTTLELSPDSIHAIGLSEVARIRAAMMETMQRSGFRGTLPQFMRFLRTDPQFYAKTPRELLSYSAYVSKKADYALSRYFGALPRYRHGILPVPAALAPIYTGGRGGLDACLMNTYNLPARPLYTLAALTLHECTPGHSFQAALAREGPSRPPFRRAAGFSGYGEGWGLYTEWLGHEMGIYETPYEEFGQLTYEMWRACRLVIDTGIHHFGWTRARAIGYLREHAALSEHEITTEVDRYIAWPGQALAYKLGEIEIRRLRRLAESRLGAAFDPRPFHDAILAMGSVPLPVLTERMEGFIAARARGDSARVP